MSRELVSPHKARVIITKNLASQIQYLHSRCPKNKEWSALLIYQVIEGSLQELNKLVVRAEGLFPMDYGDSTFTSFEGDENWLKCFSQYPQIDPIDPKPGWYIGKIHDHPNFNVYHSPTDKNDLYETAPKLPMYLSLIVNYATETNCELAVAMEVEETMLSRTRWKLKGWKNTERKIERTKNEKHMTYVMKCNVEYEQDQWMIEQCNVLGEKKPPVATFLTKTEAATLTTSKPEKSGGVKGVRKFVSNKTIANLSNLITLGEGSELTLAAALSKTDLNVSVDTREKYKKAVKMYFIDYWYDGTFYNMATTEEEVMEAILELLSLHNGWIVTTLKEAINELKSEYPKLWKVQESSVV